MKLPALPAVQRCDAKCSGKAVWLFLFQKSARCRLTICFSGSFLHWDLVGAFLNSSSRKTLKQRSFSKSQSGATSRVWVTVYERSGVPPLPGCPIVTTKIPMKSLLPTVTGTAPIHGNYNPLQARFLNHLHMKKFCHLQLTV